MQTVNAFSRYHGKFNVGHRPVLYPYASPKPSSRAHGVMAPDLTKCLYVAEADLQGKALSLSH
jgi:hypothetical protein